MELDPCPSPPINNTSTTPPEWNASSLVMESTVFQNYGDANRFCFSSAKEIFDFYGFQEVHTMTIMHLKDSLQECQPNFLVLYIYITTLMNLFLLQDDYNFDFAMLAVLAIAYRLIGFFVLLAKTYRMNK